MSEQPASPKAAEMAAVREHSVGSRRTRAHVIICHDLNERAHSLYEIFGYADRVSPSVLEALTHDLADDILRDVALLKADLDRIEAFARRQLEKANSL